MFSILFMTLTLVPFCFGSGNLPPQKPDLESVNREVEGLQLGFARMTQRLKAQEAETVNLQKSLKAEIDGLQKRLKTQEKATAATADSFFFANFWHYRNSVSSRSVIVWDTPVVNPGGHYSNTTGGYTAPYDGYYQFSVSKRSNNNQSYFWLLVDDVQHYYTGLETPTENVFGSIVSSTATINVQLNKGQVVKVQNFASDEIYGFVQTYMYSFFTGYMIAAV